MGSLNNMMSLMRPLGIYKLNGGSLIESELTSYAAGLDRLESALQELQTECFAVLAEGYGLSEMENAFNIWPKAEETIARRNLIMGYMSLSPSDCTMAAIKNQLLLHGIDAEITENPTDESLTITCVGYSGPFVDSNKLLLRIVDVLPAHLKLYITLKLGTWSFWDSRNMYFRLLDYKNQSWNQIEEFGNCLAEY